MEKWDLEDDDLGKIQKPKPLTTPRDKTGGFPLLYIWPNVPLLGRAFILHVQVALAIPLVLATSLTLYRSGTLPIAVIGSFPVTFLICTWNYIRLLRLRKRQLESPFPPHPLLIQREPDVIWYLIAPTLYVPIGLLVGSILSIWFGNRFVATFIPALISFAAFYKFGGRPIEFYFEHMICQPFMPAEYRHEKPSKDGQPNMLLLGGLLVAIVTLPILISTSVAIAAVAGFVGWFLWVRSKRVRDGNDSQIVLYFVVQAYRVARTYVDYPTVFESARSLDDANQWLPPSTQLVRRCIFFGLIGSLYAALILGLTYYCPWDIFASLFVMPNESALVTGDDLLHGYSWLFAPFLHIPLASPLAPYLLCFGIAVILFLTLPPAILLAIYYPRLVELERLHQELKRNVKHTEM
ncbi:hypothetical protein [Lacipirellula parvula]|uniref:Transmembrane protein n=1 Tax=Lacipirellula parvula TaxID=2650471 RepID=A0A5K7XBI7_9BACT|nr:hypothetical protein [Lacipirellula parvula]BBO34164.1 hypothetical protein PLANPX_3776 [Lacipirellula parvula]